ncbi:MAG: sporulation protein YunB [Ruminococcaceae bacterium]|nr:sporulation protein YunB [Oscillospiraceae bacterium]
MTMRYWLRRITRWLLILMVALTALLIAFRIRYNQVIMDLAKTQVVNSTSDLINDAVAQQIANENIQYDRIVYFEKDINGKITALKTNIGEVNRIKTDTLNVINDAIMDIDYTDMGIPLGSLFLPEVLSGRGPQIPIKILSIRNSDGYFESSFTQAGINQTLHQVHMFVLVDVAVLVLGRTMVFTVESDVVVAETIIVGDVPDTFFQTGGNYGS